MRPEKSVASVLMEARALIQKGWCQRALARDREGKAVTPSSARAVSFCAIGAMRRATGQKMDREDGAFAVLTARLPSHCPLDEFNDTARSRDEVLALFDAALTRITK